MKRTQSSNKRMRSISEGEVGRIFDEHCIRGLADRAGLLGQIDINLFVDEIRANARIYCREVYEQRSDNDLHNEIVAIHDAAENVRLDELRCLIESISSGAKAILDRQLQTAHGSFPIHIDEAAAHTIAASCRIGGRYVKGQRRPSGRRSRTWTTIYFAPELTRNPERRGPERHLLDNLGMTWLLVTGKEPPKYARQGKEGPFARLFQDCLDLCSSSRAKKSSSDAVSLINRFWASRGSAVTL